MEAAHRLSNDQAQKHAGGRWAGGGGAHWARRSLLFSWVIRPRIGHAGRSSMLQLQQLALDPHAPLHPAHSRVTQAQLHEFRFGAASCEASTRQCCAAAQWVAQRLAASYRARADFKEQDIVQVGGSAGAEAARGCAASRARCAASPALPPQALPCCCLVSPSLPRPALCPCQLTEELAAAQARRQAVIAAQPALRLHLPEALQQVPPRLDWCSECAQMVQQVGRGCARQGWGGATRADGALPGPWPSPHRLPAPLACRWSCVRSPAGIMQTLSETQCSSGACMPRPLLLLPARWRRRQQQTRLLGRASLPRGRPRSSSSSSSSRNAAAAVAPTLRRARRRQPRPSNHFSCHSSSNSIHPRTRSSGAPPTQSSGPPPRRRAAALLLGQ